MPEYSMRSDEFFFPIDAHTEESEAERNDIAPTPHPLHDVHLGSKTSSDDESCVTAVSVDIDEEGLGGYKAVLLPPDDKWTGERADGKPKRRKQKDSLNKRRRYRKAVDDIMGEIAAAPDFRADWTLLPESITNDAWLMNKLRKRIRKHQEDLRNNVMSL